MNKKAVLFVVSILVFALPVTVLGAEGPSPTNLNNVAVVEADMDDEKIITPAKIIYGDGYEEDIGTFSTYQGLFVNGSLIRNSQLINKDNYLLAPVRVVVENLGLTVTWEKDVSKATIEGLDIVLVLTKGEKEAVVNGKKVGMPIAPEIIEDKLYVPLRFIAEATKAEVTYFNGNEHKGHHWDIKDMYILPRISYAMIDKYPITWSPITKEEAIQVLKEELIIAYESYFDEPFVEVEKEDRLEKRDTFSMEHQEYVRHEVSYGLQVSSENNRFYSIHFGFDMWVDKYTKEVLLFYNGMTMTINEFDPLSEHSLSFAG